MNRKRLRREGKIDVKLAREFWRRYG